MGISLRPDMTTIILAALLASGPPRLGGKPKTSYPRGGCPE